MTPSLDDQGNTFRCGPFCARQWFEGYGWQVTGTKAYAAALAVADSQKGFSFDQERTLVNALCLELGAAAPTWLGDGFLRDFPTFNQALMDGWSLIVGVALGDLHPGENFYHFDCLYSVGGELRTADPFHVYDGDNGHPDFAAMVQAIKDNWDPVLIGLAFRLAPAVVRPSAAPTVETLLHKIGGLFYQTPVPAAEGQQLVQQALTIGGWQV